MIHNISSTVSDWLVQSKIIAQNDYDLFEYAVYSFLWGLTPTFIAVALGLLSGMLSESLILIIPIILIRKFSGGFHLESPKHCIILSVTILAIALGIVRVITVIKCKEILSIMVIGAIISISFHSPIDCDARKLTHSEKALFQKIARIFSIFAFFIYIVLVLSDKIAGYSAWGVGVVVTALLQVPCILKTK